MAAAAPLADLALEALACGYAVMPPRADGSKRPAGDAIPPDCQHPDCVRTRDRANGSGRPAHGWVHWQHARPNEGDIARWYRGGTCGIGLICGTISGGLELLEFEGRAVDEGLVEAYAAAAEQAGLTPLVDRIYNGYAENTPTGGLHLLWRCPDGVEGNLKLARRRATEAELEQDPDDKVKVLIETRGEGGYVIVAPTSGSVHPTGRAWELARGALNSVASITAEERTELLDLARSFDRMPRPLVGQPAPRSTRPPDADEIRPGDDYNQRPDAHDRALELLQAHGWRLVFERGDELHLRRPGKHTGSASAVLHRDGGVLYVFSTSTTFEAERGYSPFAIYAHLEHEDDHSAAARALADQGYGTQRPPRHERPVPKEPDQPPPRDDETTPEAEYLPLRTFNLAALMRTGITEPHRIADWLYAGGLTALNSEPGVGKTWVAIWLAHRAMLAGGHVLYLDEEGGPELVTERLCALGADPDLVGSHLTYVPFPTRRWDNPDLLALAAQLRDNTALCVFDSLPDFLAIAGRDEDRATQVTEWVNRVCGTLRRQGVAQLVLDHLNKPATGETKAKRSRYSRGSGSKLAKADGTLLLEVVTEFDADTSGQLRLWKTKDRRGRLPVPSLTKPALTLDVTVTAGQVRFAPSVAAESGPSWDGPTECMSVVLDLLRSATPEEFTGNQLCARVRAADHPFRDKTIREAADRLEITGAITARPGANRSRLYSWRPENTQEDPLDEDF